MYNNNTFYLRTRPLYLRDNKQDCASNDGEASDVSGRKINSKSERSGGFDAVIRPEPQGASQRTNSPVIIFELFTPFCNLYVILLQGHIIHRTWWS